MSEDQRKYLEMIQAVITRMAGNSFLIRGWSVTLVSALFALAAKDADRQFVLVSYFPCVMFWCLDAYYLSQERKFRSLYDAARKASSTDFWHGHKASRAIARQMVIRFFLDDNALVPRGDCRSDKSCNVEIGPMSPITPRAARHSRRCFRAGHAAFQQSGQLKRIIAMIDEEDRSTMDVDVKGAAFEGLLEKAASEGKKGAGQ